MLLLVNEGLTAAIQLTPFGRWREALRRVTGDA